MKIYTCANESELAKYIPFSTVRVKFYEDMAIPYGLFEALINELKMLKVKVSTNFFFAVFVFS